MSDFPELAPLRENWQVIRDEAKRLYDGEHIRSAENHNDLAFNSFFRRGWKRFYPDGFRGDVLARRGLGDVPGEEAIDGQEDRVADRPLDVAEEDDADLVRVVPGTVDVSPTNSPDSSTSSSSSCGA